MDAGVMAVLAVGMLAALAVGWLIGARPLKSLQVDLAGARQDRDAIRVEAETWRAKFNEAAVNMAAQAEQVQRLAGLERELAGERQASAAARSEADQLRPVAERAVRQDRELTELRAEKEALAAAKAALERGEAERTQAHEKQLAQLKDLEAKLEARFGELAAKAVDGAHDRFLKQAEERFGHAGKQNEEKLKALLQPVHDTLQRHGEHVSKIERDRTESYGNLTGLIEAMRTGQEAVRSEAARLVNSLRAAPKARGRWGEQQLRNVLESCGLTEHCDFQTEVSVEGEDGRLRPDVIVKVPGGRQLVIDAKVSLNSYQDAHGAPDESVRAQHLALHAAAIKAHVKSLGDKAYWTQFADADDYVVMFIPGEHFLAAALESDPTLWDFAFGKRVLLATPTNLVAIARTVAAVWRQEKLARDAQRIAELGKEMHDRLAVASKKLRSVGTGLNGAVKSYNEFVSSFETRLQVSGRKFRDLNVDVGSKEIEPLQAVESLAGYCEDGATGENVELPQAAE